MLPELQSVMRRLPARTWTKLTGRRRFVMLLVHAGSRADCLPRVPDFGVASLILLVAPLA